jgi:hypothetical protein
MIRKCLIYSFLTLIFFFIINGCTSNTAADKYAGYLNHVISILENSKIGASIKGTEIDNFIQKNKSEIEKVLADLKAMSPKETEHVVDKVQTKVDAVLERIDLAAKDTPQLAEDVNLIEALKTLKVIGE